MNARSSSPLPVALAACMLIAGVASLANAQPPFVPPPPVFTPPPAVQMSYAGHQAAQSYQTNQQTMNHQTQMHYQNQQLAQSSRQMLNASRASGNVWQPAHVGGVKSGAWRPGDQLMGSNLQLAYRQLQAVDHRSLTGTERVQYRAAWRELWLASRQAAH